MKKIILSNIFSLFFCLLFLGFAFFNFKFLDKALALEENHNDNLEHFFIEETSNPSDSEIISQVNSETIPSKNFIVVIDPGHGGTDPGSIGYKTKIHEDKLNLQMSKLLKEKLENAGINVVMTRETDDALIEGRGRQWKRDEMKARRELIVKTRPNMVISIHQNSYTNHSLRGAQVFYDKKSETSKTIAENIQEQFKINLDKSIKVPSPGDYYMLKCSPAPSVIVECGFLSHPEEEMLLQTAEYQNKIIDSIYKGIVNFLQNN